MLGFVGCLGIVLSGGLFALGFGYVDWWLDLCCLFVLGWC